MDCTHRKWDKVFNSYVMSPASSHQVANSIIVSTC